VERSPRETGARLAGWLMVAAGCLTILNNYLPGAESLNRGVLNLLGGVAVGLGAAFFVLPWDGWPDRANLVVVPLALALISLGDLLGGVSAFSYGVFFVVLFMWVGLTQPLGTSFAVGPLAVVAYVVPGLFAAHPPTGAVSSVTVAIPVCLLVGETIARVTRRLALREEQYRRLVEMSQQGIWELDAANYTTYANPRWSGSSATRPGRWSASTSTASSTGRTGAGGSPAWPPAPREGSRTSSCGARTARSCGRR
jgi:PAS domain-containing protein